MTLEIIALVVAAMIALVLRSMTGTWAHPSSLTAGAWTSFLAIPVIALPNVHPFGGAAWIIVLMIVVVGTSAPLAFKPNDVHPGLIRSSKWLSRFVVLGSFAAVASAIVAQRANGISIGNVISFDTISRASRSLTVMRYDGTLTAPAIATVLLGLTYGAALAAPFAAASRRGLKKVILLWLPSLGGAFYALMTTARSSLLITVAITVSSWLVVLAIKSGGRPKLPFRTMIGLLISACATAGFFILVTASRAGGFDSTSLARLRQTVALYAGGSIPAFNTWYPDAGSPQFGAQTFAGIAQFLVGDKSLGAAYRGFADIGGELSTNVFTALRPLAEDFTVPGMIVAVGVFSWFAAIAFRRAVTKHSVSSAVLCAAWGAFVLFSQTTSIYSFVNVTFGVVVAGILIVRTVTFTPHDAPSLTPPPTVRSLSRPSSMLPASRV